MPPQTRRMTFPNVVIERDEDSEESSSSSSEEEQEMNEIEEEEEEEEIVGPSKKEEEIDEKMVENKKKGKAPITISLKKVCKVSIFPLYFYLFSVPFCQFLLIYLLLGSFC